MNISAIEGNRQWLDGGSMFGNAPRAMWERWTEVDEIGRIPLACRCLLLETEKFKILFETGIGAFFEPKLADRFGIQNHDRHMLLENLANMNVTPDQIDYVVLSHLHFDHAGGLLPTHAELSRGHEELVFPKAKFVVGDNAWARAQNPHFRDRASFVPLLNKKLAESNRLILIKNGLVPEPLNDIFSVFESEGHTPGQMHSLIKGNSNTIVFAGDLIPGSNWVHLPITMGYDRYPEKLIEEKEQLYKSFMEQGLKIFFTHDPKYAMGDLTKNEKGRFSATSLQENFQNLEI